MQKDNCEITCEFSAEWSRVRLPNLPIVQGAIVLCLREIFQFTLLKVY